MVIRKRCICSRSKINVLLLSIHFILSHRVIVITVSDKTKMISNNSIRSELSVCNIQYHCIQFKFNYNWKDGIILKFRYKYDFQWPKVICMHKINENSYDCLIHKLIKQQCATRPWEWFHLVSISTKLVIYSDVWSFHFDHSSVSNFA